MASKNSHKKRTVVKTECPPLQVLPSNQQQIRSMLQSLPDETFGVWCYEIGAERHRRTETRQSSTILVKRQHRGVGAMTVDHQQEQTNDADGNVETSGVSNGGEPQPQLPAAATTTAASTSPTTATNSATAQPSSDQQSPSLSPSSARPTKRMRPDDDVVVAASEQEPSPVNNSNNTARTAASTTETNNTNKKTHQHEIVWSQRFQELVDYRIQHGHVDVPDDAIPKLSKWVQSQRQAYKKRQRGEKTSMTDERLQKLQNVGFKFSIKDDWMTRYQQLLDFREKHGHARVPQHYKEQNNLGVWVKGQRAAYRYMTTGMGKKTTNHHKLDAERIQKLNDIGFEWVVKSRK